MNKSLYWHDYETFGLDPSRDRPAQFAGIRTDYDLNVIAEPLVIYCQPAEDYLPQPEACVVTGITPQITKERGICEAKFIALIHKEIASPDTCTLGYNNLRFDDEVTRNLLYRNFFDPYGREWQNGNSRWDLIDLVRATYALRPDGINWPENEDGSPSFRLELLTAANGLEHSSAHDALSDVYATIAFAKLLRNAQAKLYQFFFQHRSKSKALSLLKLGSMQPLLHVSGMYGKEQSRLAVVVPVCQHPVNKNGVLVYDLSVSPEPLFDLSVEELHQSIFTATDELPDHLSRVPIKTVHINKCPFLAPMSALRSQDIDRLQINLPQCQQNLEKIKKHAEITSKLAKVFSKSDYTVYKDPDLLLYGGGFFQDKDRALMEKIRKTQHTELADLELNFADKRLPEMFFRYKARNFPASLSPEEKERWRQLCLQRLTEQSEAAAITLEHYKSKLSTLKDENVQVELLTALHSYADELLLSLNR